MNQKLLAVSLLILCVAAPVRAASIKIGWNPSTYPAVVGYKVHYGTETRKYAKTIQVEGRLTTEAVVENLDEGKTYFFSITACDAKGNESPYSPEITNGPKKSGRKPPAGQSENTAGPRQTSKGMAQSVENDSGTGQTPSPNKIPPSRSVGRTQEGKILPSRELIRSPQ